MQDRAPKRIQQLLTVLQDQDNNFPGLDLLPGQRARKSTSAAQELIVGDRKILPPGKLQINGHPVRGPVCEAL